MSPGEKSSPSVYQKPMPETSPESHDSIIKALARLEAGQEGLLRRIEQDVIPRIDRINGSVASVTEEQGRIRLEMARHPGSCPIVERVHTLESEIMRGEQPPSKEGMARLTTVEAKVSKMEASKEINAWWVRGIFTLIGAGAAIAGRYIK